MTVAPPGGQFKILIIDDSESIHADYRKSLGPPPPASSYSAAKAALLGQNAVVSPLTARFKLESAFQGQEGMLKVEAAKRAGEPFHVAFVDMRMPPGWDGLETIRRLWAVDADLQVVICTAYSDHALDELPADLAQSDQLLILKKPFDSVEVVQLAGALSRKRLAQEAASAKREELERLVRARTAEIEHAMLHDKLTGLPNRTMLTMQLEASIQRRKRHPEQKFAVLFLDFDRFKLVNDSLGHEIGDLLLIEIALRLRESLRGGDVVGHTCMPSRMGGDEFIVLIEDLREERDAARVAQRLLTSLSAPYALEAQTLQVTASIGVATSDRDYERAVDMIRDADAAMYRAKAAGRARYVMFDRAMHQDVADRLALENAMRRGVQNDEMILHYQPIIRLVDGSLSGFEALVRWTDPELGPVRAGDLIAVAEDTGMIQPLSANLLRRACRQFCEWRERFEAARGLMLAFNLSRRLLIDSDLVSKVAQTLEEFGIDPRSLVMEITESAVANEKEGAIAAFREFQKLGVWLHLDDFGTGYSSLSCLYRWPLSGLKIDQSFIKEACSRPEHAKVLSALIDIARAFNLQVIAEGIETTEQLALLRSLGVEHGQGYLLGSPCDPEHAVMLLQDRSTLCFA